MKTEEFQDFSDYKSKNSVEKFGAVFCIFAKFYQLRIDKGTYLWYYELTEIKNRGAIVQK